MIILFLLFYLSGFLQYLYIIIFLLISYIWSIIIKRTNERTN